MIKNTDTIIIYGGGTSLKDISSEEYEIFKDVDSIAVNLFIKTEIHLTHYILGEGLLYLLHRIRIENNENDRKNLLKEYNEYINLLNEKYVNTQIIFIINYSNMSFLNEYVDIIKKDLTNQNIKYMNCDNEGNDTVDYIRNNKLYHKGCGINCCISYAYRMGYKNVIFIGVDLYDSKYAYNSINIKLLNKNELEVHSTKNEIFKYISTLKNKINLSTYNPKSLLSEIIPIYKKN